MHVLQRFMSITKSSLSVIIIAAIDPTSAHHAPLLISKELNHFCHFLHGFSQGVKSDPRYITLQKQNLINVILNLMRFVISSRFKTTAL